MKWTKQRLNNLFFIIGVIAVVVMILTFDVSFVELWDHLTKAGYWLIPIVGVWLLVYGLNALAWQCIIRSNTDENDKRVSFWRIYRLTITGYALNYATPVGGLGGEPYRIMELSRDISKEHATSSVILYAMMHFVAHFGLWFSSIFLYLALAAIDYVPMTPAIGMAMAAAIIFCLAAFYIFSKGYKHGLVVRLIRWTGRIPGLKGWSARFQERHAEALAHIDAQIAALHKQDKRAFYGSLLLEYASRIVQSMEILFMLLLFGIDCGGGFEGLLLTFLYSILILSFTSLLANLIGFLPMQLGVQEGGFMVSIALIGMSTKLGANVDSAALGIFVSIICRVREIIWIFIGIMLMKIDNLKPIKVAVLLLPLIMLLTGCGDDGGNPEEDDSWRNGKAERAVLVYMAGENNLTNHQGYHFLQSDFNEMVEGSRQLTNRQRLLVFVDSLNSLPAIGTPYIVELHGGQVYPVKNYGQEFYSSDPSRFREVLQTMMATAEADSYGLVLWGHASGWAVSTDTVSETQSRDTRAYGQDNGVDGRTSGIKHMNITQMARALDGLPAFEFIFADCCNMMCAEVAYELRHATRYLIGSPAEIPGDGAPYAKVIPYLYESGEALYKGVIDTYYDHYLEAYRGDYSLDGYSVPLAVTDSRYLEPLAEQTRALLPRLMPNYPNSPDMESKGIVHYWFYDHAPMMYDMRGTMKAFADAAAFAGWDAAYRQAVPYYRMSMKWLTIYGNLEYDFSYFAEDAMRNGCVSMFIPLNNGYYDQGTFCFNKTFRNYEWNRLMGWERFGWTEE